MIKMADYTSQKMMGDLDEVWLIFYLIIATILLLLAANR